jgi:hypothetical protein
MSSVAFLKPVKPSKTLANFLANNTNLPVLVWWIILKFKYYYEEGSLGIDKQPGSTSSRLKLRSGCRYMSYIDKTSLTDRWFDDSYRLINKFDRTKKSKVKGTLHHDKMIYDCLISQMNYLMNWIHIISLNAETKDYMKNFMEQGLYTSITGIYNDIYKPELIKSAEYKNWCINIVEDLKTFKDYIKCPCEWRKNPKNKCCHCIDFEQYFYNYDTYYDNFTILRSGKRILKRGGVVKKPIIVQKVYQVL